MNKSNLLNININGNMVNLVINRKKIKNTYIRIDEHQIIVNTNLYTSVEYIKELIYKNQDKIIKQLENKSKKYLKDGSIDYLGKTYQLKCIFSHHFAYNMTDDTIILYTNKEESIAIDEFYRQCAEEIFSTLLVRAFGFYETNFKIQYPELEIRKMKNRYGTCYYSRNKICLNLYLIKHDLECINYVIHHELCHFIHHDHSKAFYQLLETVVKNHKDLRTKIFNL